MFLKKLITRFLIVFVFAFTISSILYAGGGEGDIAVLSGINPIKISDAEVLMGKPDTVLFDANTADIRKDLGTIQNAILIDTETIYKLLPKDKNTTLIFYCLNKLCSASSEASLIAKNEGYKNNFVMLEGIEGWALSGRAVVKTNIQDWLTAKEVDNFTDYLHQGLIFGELPACRDCHGTDGSKIEIDKAANKLNVNANCASCHKVEKALFDNSTHSEKMPSNKKIGVNVKKSEQLPQERPTCWSCHKIHKKDMYETLNRKQMAERNCGSCHQEKMKFFRESFHGKALFLTTADDNPNGLPSCYNCHTMHSVHKAENPSSSLFSVTKVETCKECHEGSNENFVGYLSHPDKGDKDQNAAIYYISLIFIIIITVVFVFFGVHTILWWIRMLMMRLQNPVAWREARAAAHHDKVAVRRFSILHRIQHFAMGISFLTLALTGLPQMLYSAPWAKNISAILGGPKVFTSIHHIAAVVLFLVFISHIIEVSMVAWKRKESIRNPKTGKIEMKRFWSAFFGPESLFPRMQDLKDLVAHMRWFLYMGPRPQFDRWTYWEKFDYLAEVWGMFTFGITGLILWFPTSIGSIFPGWVINLSTVIHSYEALLAIGFIFAVHFFNTHFRIDRFPMDMVIFSGNITKEEMKQERKIWYDRLKASGKLDELINNGEEFNKYAIVAKVLGFLMLGLGLLFLILMIYAYII